MFFVAVVLVCIQLLPFGDRHSLDVAVDGVVDGVDCYCCSG